MKKKTISFIIITSIIISAAALFTNCWNSDMAIVTIHIEGRTTAATEHPVKPKSLIDRFLMLFSSPAYAWSYTPDTLLIQITGIEDVYFESFPLDTNTFSYEVPAGVPITITVITENNDSGKNWSARTTVNLTPGQEADIVMKMIPVTAITGVSYIGEYMQVYLEEVPAYAQVYRLYRSTSENGPFTYINSATNDPSNCDGDCWVRDYSASELSTYYYKVTVVNEFGEGQLSDPIPYYIN